MKTNELKSIIRGIIQEELKTMLPTMIPQILTEILTGNVKNNIKEETNIVEPIKHTQPKAIKKYTNNEMLNKVLNETVGGVPKEGSFVGYSDPLTKTSGISSFESQQSYLNESIETSSVPVNKEQSKVMNLINRDFRSLMKAVDKKKREGNIPSGIVTAE